MSFEDTEMQWREVIDLAATVDDTTTEERDTLIDAASFIVDKLDATHEAQQQIILETLQDGLEMNDSVLIDDHIDMLHDIAMVRCARHINGNATTVEDNQNHVGFQ